MSGDRVADAQLPGAEGDDLDVDGVLVALQVGFGLRVLLLVGGERLEADALELLGGLVADLRQVRGLAVNGGEEALGLAERALGLIDLGALQDHHVVGRLVLGLAVEVTDLVALLGAGLARLLLFLLALLLGVAVFALLAFFAGVGVLGGGGGGGGGGRRRGGRLGARARLGFVV